MIDDFDKKIYDLINEYRAEIPVRQMVPHLHNLLISLMMHDAKKEGFHPLETAQEFLENSQALLGSYILHIESPSRRVH